MVIDPDEFREALLRRLIAAGTLPEVAEAVGLEAPLTPLEIAPVVHAEASHVAREAEKAARSRGLNILVDSTMADAGTARARIDALRNDGYRQIDGIFVDVTLEQAYTSAVERWRRGVEQYTPSGEGLGGRYVATELIVGRRDPTGRHRSVNRQVFEELRASRSFAGCYLYRRDADRVELVATSNGSLAVRAGLSSPPPSRRSSPSPQRDQNQARGPLGQRFFPPRRPPGPGRGFGR